MLIGFSVYVYDLNHMFCISAGIVVCPIDLLPQGDIGVGVGVYVPCHACCMYMMIIIFSHISPKKIEHQFITK